MCHYIINGSTIIKFIQIKGKHILGKSPSLLHNLIMWACLFNPPHVYHPWYKSTLEIGVLLKQSTQCFFGWGIFTLWEYVVIDSLFVIKKLQKNRIFKEGERENFTSSMSIGYYFLFWWFFVNKSPLNAKFVWNKIKVAYGTFQGPKDVSYVFETHIMYLDVWFFPLTYGIILKPHMV